MTTEIAENVVQKNSHPTQNSTNQQMESVANDTDEQILSAAGITLEHADTRPLEQSPVDLDNLQVDAFSAEMYDDGAAVQAIANILAAAEQKCRQ